MEKIEKIKYRRSNCLPRKVLMWKERKNGDLVEEIGDYQENRHLLEERKDVIERKRQQVHQSFNV